MPTSIMMWAIFYSDNCVHLYVLVRYHFHRAVELLNVFVSVHCIGDAFRGVSDKALYTDMVSSP